MGSQTLCRGCGGCNLQTVLDLGLMPLANALLPMEIPPEPERRHPLVLVYCPSCTLIQITETVPPEILFRNYTYFSSYSTTMLDHAENLAETLIRSNHLTEKSLVVEIASNDGYLLQFFKKKGIDVLGIEPAVNVAQAAAEKGIPTVTDFFSAEVGQRLAREGRAADVVIGNNVLAHVADLHGFLDGVRDLLKPEGCAVFEAPYALDFIGRCEFDTIYHEHLCYYSLSSLVRLFARHGLNLFDVERIPVHGGSIRIYAAKKETPPGQRLVKLMEEEREIFSVLDKGTSLPTCLTEFAHRSVCLRDEIRDLAARLSSDGKTIAAYGAAAKGCVLMNFCELNQDLIGFVMDKNPVKQGRRMPGTHQPIFSPDKLRETPPDYLMILPWNLADEIMRQESHYHSQGGRFIIPVPEVRVQ